MRVRSWNDAIYYGEVLGFAVAWVIGIVVALGNDRPRTSGADASTVAAAPPASDALFK